ncbi:RNA polymerase sigma factor [Planctomycetota bacterium]
MLVKPQTPRVRNMEPKELADTVTAAQQYDAQAFKRLMAHYSNSVYAVMVGSVGNFELARDLTQDVFLEVYRSLPKLQAPESFVAWLFTIARNKALTALRYLERERKALGKIASRKKSPNPFNQPGEGDDLLEKALAALSEEDREIILFKHLEQKTVAQIASLLSLSRDGVKSRLARARKRMRRSLQVLRKRL